MKIRIILAAILCCALLAPDLAAYVVARTISGVDGQIVVRRWANSAFPIQWRMNPTRGTNVTGAREQADVFRLAFQAWSSQSTALISFSEGPVTAASLKPAYDQINQITTNLTNQEFLEVGASGALAVAGSYFYDAPGVDEFGRRVDFPGQTIECDILFNPAFALSTDLQTPADKADVQAVATHEIGHLLGLEHSPLISATMFPSTPDGVSYARQPSNDDVLGVSSIYPSPTFAARASLSGTVQTLAKTPVYGAVVVAVNSTGQAVASAVTDPNGRYTIAGLDPGAYTVYAEPMDEPFNPGNLGTLGRIYPGRTVLTNFGTRYR